MIIIIVSYYQIYIIKDKFIIKSNHYLKVKLNGQIELLLSLTGLTFFQLLTLEDCPLIANFKSKISAQFDSLNLFS